MDFSLNQNSSTNQSVDPSRDFSFRTLSTAPASVCRKFLFIGLSMEIIASIFSSCVAVLAVLDDGDGVRLGFWWFFIGNGGTLMFNCFGCGMGAS